MSTIMTNGQQMGSLKFSHSVSISRLL